MLLVKNSIIQWIRNSEDEEISMMRVLFVDEKQDLIILYPLSFNNEDCYLPLKESLSEIHKEISDELAFIKPVDPFERKINFNVEPFNQYLEYRNNLWERVGKYLKDEPDIYDEKLRGAIVKDILDGDIKGLRTKKSIYRLFRKQWKYGNTKDNIIPLVENMGAPGQPRPITMEMLQQAKTKEKKIPKRGRPRFILEIDPTQEGINLDEVSKKNIIRFLKKAFETPKKRTLKEVYVDFLTEYYSKGTRLNKDGISVPIFDPKRAFPSLDQFKSVFYQNRDLKRELIKREGVKKFNKDQRPVLGSTTENDQLGAGSVYQIDSTIACVHLVNRIDRKRKIGKANLYVAMDVLSRKIIGKYISVTSSSWNALQMTLFDAFTNVGHDNMDKPLLDKICYLPRRIVWDRAKEQLGVASDRLGDALGIAITCTASYSPHHKPSVEQSFNYLRKKFVSLPGAVKKGYKERGEHDYRLDAIFTIDEFSEEVEKIIDHYNNHYLESYPLNEKMLIDNVYPYPNELWDWGIKKGGALNQCSAQKAMFHLMPQKKAAVTSKGITLGRSRYTCDYIMQNRWLERARNNHRWKVDVAYDERNPRYIYLLLDDGRIECCELNESDKFHQEYYQIELDDINKREKVKADSRRAEQYEAEASLKLSMEESVKNATEKTKMDHIGVKGGKSNVSNIKENRSVEKDLTRREEAELISSVLQNKALENKVFITNDSDDEDEDMIATFQPKQTMLRHLINR